MNSLETLNQALTSKKWQWLIHSSNELPVTRLVEFLKIKLPHIEPASWLSRFELGGVYLNGLRVESDIKLDAPCKIEYYEPKFLIDSITDTFPPFDKKKDCF